LLENSSNLNNENHKAEDHNHDNENLKCVYKKQCEEYSKSIKELTKLYEEIRKKYELLGIKTNQE